MRAGLRWTAAVAVLVLLGAGAAGAGWRELADDDARRRAACVARAAEDAQAFAAVLGDTRPVDPAALERSCR